MHKVDAKGILSSSNGMNIYRGCQHNCIYCDSRSLCYGMEHDFEDIEVKQNAPFLLEKALKSKRKKCMIGTGAMTDPYIPLERELKLTRQCLEIIDRYGFGATVLTKSADVLRDLDLFKSINSKSKAVVQMTLTTYDESLCRIIEPNVSSTKERFESLKTFRDNGIATVVWLDPFLPFINDIEENIRGLLDYCVKAKVKGIICFDIGLTLRSGNREYFYKQLDRHFPKLKEKYIRTYGNSYQITSKNSSKLMKIVTDVCRKNGIMCNVNEVFAYLHKFESKEEQLTLFDMG
ncbi:radical SAM protein [Ruminococcus sp.]|uniref:SPL family radical SAM protein n=1 Tax=Ruminococcus sp. TaxID=41978 RepID=UPI0025D924A7|nr:radical SAM protein [Ruminococcus sp.]MCI6615968.1 radical SAM protein [Ruminococcus sp.]